MNKKIVILVALICTIVVSFDLSIDVFADGKGWIGANSGGSSNIWGSESSECSSAGDYKYAAYCAGMSWIYYKAETATNNAISFAPFNHLGYLDSNPTVSIPAECSNNGKGGFWHFGVNGQGNSSGKLTGYNGNSTLYQTSEYSWGHWSTYTDRLRGHAPYYVPGEGGYNRFVNNSWNSLSSGYTHNWNVGSLDHRLGKYVGGEFVTYYYAEKYAGSFDAVLPDYKKAYERKFGAGSADGIGGIPDDVYAFCYWEDDFYGLSAGWATDESGENTLVEEVTTDIVQKDSESVVISEVVELGGTVNLNFKHNVYSKEPNKEVWWRASETWLDTSNEINTGNYGGFTIENVEPTIDKATIGSEIIESNGETYYLPENNPVITTTTPVTFTKGGVYVFCQDLKMDEEENKVTSAKVTSEACIAIEVKVNYYGMSGASVEADDGVSSSTATEIVPMDSKVTASPDAKITVELGLGKHMRKVTLTFVHDIYADSESGEVFWGINRNQDLVDVGFDANFRYSSPLHFLSTRENGYYVNEPTNIWYCDVHPNSDFCRSYWGMMQYCMENGLDEWQCNNYVNFVNGGIEELSSSYNDGKYVIKESVDVTYWGWNKGTHKYCEKLYMAKKESDLGSAPFTSQACVVVEVKDAEFESSELGSYVWSKVRNSRLGGDYSGWKGIKDEFEDPESATDATEEKDDPAEGNVVYARPNDNVDWEDIYASGAQGNYGKEVIYVNDSTVGVHANDSGCSNTTNTYAEGGFGGKNAGDWVNNYSIEQATPSLTSDLAFEKGVGQVSVYTERHTHKVLQDEVGGLPFHDLIYTVGNTPVYSFHNGVNHSWECTKGYYIGDEYYTDTETHEHTNWVTTGLFNSSQLASQSYLKVPYNFNNTASFTISTPEPLYPGETVQVTGSEVTVGPRKNDVVESTYATKVDGAIVKLIAYVSEAQQEGTSTVPSSGSDLCGYVSHIEFEGFCKEVNGSSGTLEVADDKTNSGQTHNNNIIGTEFDTTYDVFDAKAGDFFCMTLGVYPATSGTNDKQMDPKGDNSWYLYTPQCIQIAKKPSFQVWGAGLYSAGSISTNVSQKNNLYKVNGYQYGVHKNMVFGSWAEENVTTNGVTSLFASGAGLGMTSKGFGGIEGSLESGGGGVDGFFDGDDDAIGGSSGGGLFCNKFVALSFANYGEGICPDTNQSGYAQIKATAFNTAANIGAIAEYWDGPNNEINTDAGDIIIDDLGGIDEKYRIVSATGKDIRVMNTEGEKVTIYSGNIDGNSTRIIKAMNESAVVSITGNIEYYDDNDNKYTSTHDLPKAIIYSFGDIEISCSVTRIDAILIAKGTVDTCTDYSVDDPDSDPYGLKSRDRSFQLIVNGTIIANELILGRTYGNTMGASSGGFLSPTLPGSDTPAEIINYDTSIILWGSSMAGSAESNTLTVTYQHELAPRY